MILIGLVIFKLNGSGKKINLNEFWLILTDLELNNLVQQSPIKLQT